MRLSWILCFACLCDSTVARFLRWQDPILFLNVFDKNCISMYSRVCNYGAHLRWLISVLTRTWFREHIAGPLLLLLWLTTLTCSSYLAWTNVRPPLPWSQGSRFNKTQNNGHRKWKYMDKAEDQSQRVQWSKRQIAKKKLKSFRAYFARRRPSRGPCFPLLRGSIRRIYGFSWLVQAFALSSTRHGTMHFSCHLINPAFYSPACRASVIQGTVSMPSTNQGTSLLPAPTDAPDAWRLSLYTAQPVALWPAVSHFAGRRPSLPAWVAAYRFNSLQVQQLLKIKALFLHALLYVWLGLRRVCDSVKIW